MITEALKYIRAMKHQLEVYAHAEKVLEELSVLAETGAAIRAENRDASERLMKINHQADSRLNDTQTQIKKMEDSSAAKLAEVDRVAKMNVQNLELDLNDSAEAYQQYTNAVKEHKLYMEKAEKEKAAMEKALEDLKKRFKV